MGSTGRARSSAADVALVILQFLAAIGAGILATIGIFFRGAEGRRTIDGRYGPAEIVRDGLYEGNSPAVVAEGIGWDIVTLGLAVPLLAVLAVPAYRGALAARIASAGGLFYLLYQYHQYAVTYAFGPLMPGFILVAAISLVALLLSFGTLPPMQPTERYPRRLMTGIMLMVPLALIAMWSQRIGSALGDRARAATIVGHYTTLPVQAMDLIWLAAPGLLLAVLLVRRVRISYVAAAVLAVKGATMGLAIVAMVSMAGIETGETDWGGLVMFVIVAVVCTYGAARAIKHLDAQPASAD